jgi:hypothetical protein
MCEWFEYSKDIKNIPRNLPAHYKEKWINVSHWLGIETVATNFRKYMCFKDAREYIRSLSYIGTWGNLLSDINLPHDIPRTPHHVYKEEWISYSDFIGCELKNKSKGELSIIKFLNTHSISHEYQKKFPDCLYKRPLIFDFWLPEFNIIIEYDGIQHFQPVEYFGGMNALNDLKNKDNKTYVGYSPGIGIDSNRLINDFPNIRILHVVRNPFSAYRDTKRRPFPQEIKKYLITWNIYHSTVSMYEKNFPKNVKIVKYEDLIEDILSYQELLEKENELNNTEQIDLSDMDLFLLD